MKRTTKKARLSKGLFYRPTLKLTTGLFQYASQYDSTSQFPDWQIGEKNRSITLLNAESNISLFLSNVSIRYTKEVIDEDFLELFKKIGNSDLEKVNDHYVKEFDVKVTKSVIVEFQEIIELDVDYTEIVTRIKKRLLNDKFDGFSRKFTEFSNVSYVADYKDDKGVLFSVLLGPANRLEARDLYVNHIINRKKEENLNIGDNNLFVRLTMQRSSEKGIKIDNPGEDFESFEGELVEIRNKIVSTLDDANKNANKKTKSKK